jgi:hypothetical protein
MERRGTRSTVSDLVYTIPEGELGRHRRFHSAGHAVANCKEMQSAEPSTARALLIHFEFLGNHAYRGQKAAIGRVKNLSHFHFFRVGGIRSESLAAISCFARLSNLSITSHHEVLPLSHLVDEMCRNLAAVSIRAECPSGNAPTTRVRRRISRMIRSSGSFVRICLQWVEGYEQ